MVKAMTTKTVANKPVKAKASHPAPIARYQQSAKNPPPPPVAQDVATPPPPDGPPAKASVGRPPKPRPTLARMRAARGELPAQPVGSRPALVDALIDTLVDAIDQALPAELAALSKQLLDTVDRRAALEKRTGGTIQEAAAKRTARRAGTVAAVAPDRGGRQRG